MSTTKQGTGRRFDVDFIIDFEAGEVTEDEVIEAFQDGVNTGMVWSLQGSYGRTADALLSAGYITLPDEPVDPALNDHLSRVAF